MTVSYAQPLVLLEVFGVGPATITAVGEARAIQAVEDEDVAP